ncbi:MAG TPA: nuclear transport factor 2 family protein [Terriglobales bacterium]
MAAVAKPAIDAETMIRAIAQEWVKHHNERNIDKLLTLVTNDVRICVPNKPLAEGPKAMRILMEQLFKEYDTRNLTVVTTQIEIGGDIAYSFGTFKMNMLLPSGRRLDDVGKWMVTLRRVGEEWKVTGQSVNTDLPITALAA